MIPRAAIVILTRQSRVPELGRGLTALQQNFLARWPYPVRVYHEGDIAPEQQQALIAICPTLEFRLVDLTPPPGINVAEQPTWPHPAKGVGYRSMCRFFSVQLWPLLEPDLDWVWRLDDDSVVGPVPNDLFAQLAATDAVYAYRATARDGAHVTRGLLECTQKATGGKPRSWDRSIFYNNCFLARIAWWRRPQIVAVLEHIDRTGKIYTQRWGDAPIHTLVLSALADRQRVLHLKNFDYKHGRSWAAGY